MTPLPKAAHAPVVTRYDDAQTHFDNLPDPRTLTPDEQIAHAQVAATLAQAEAIHAALDLLSHIGLAPDSSGYPPPARADGTIG